MIYSDSILDDIGIHYHMWIQVLILFSKSCYSGGISEMGYHHVDIDQVTRPIDCHANKWCTTSLFKALLYFHT